MSIHSQPIRTASASSTLADVLERVLEKGIVIAGDITVSVGNVELLNVRIRLLIASVDKAKEIGINWWESDPYLNSRTHELLETNRQLQQRVVHLEQQLAQVLPQASPEPEEP